MRVRLPRHGSILATFYSGVGDAILHGPVLASLRHTVGDRLLIPETAGAELLDLDPALRGIRTMPGQFRKLHILPTEEALLELRRMNVSALLSFRRDRVVEPERYERFAEALTGAGILHRDACEGVPPSEQVEVHTTRFAARFLSTLSISLTKPVAWLAPFVQGDETIANRRGTIGVYLGASVPVKRLPIEFWCETLTLLGRDHSLHPLLIAGLSTAEISLADSVSKRLAASGVLHSRAIPQSLRVLAGLLRRLDCVLTGDTFALHLAEALAVPVVAVHCATDPRVYGVQLRTNRSVASPFYAVCPDRNLVGNCNGWTQGCSHLTCQQRINVSDVVEATVALSNGGPL